jgi:peptidoglycan/xylan/chitin deacetylase (PgdA/CDA1 family)
VTPVGYRAPYGESCEELRVSLAERGFLYSSSFRDDVRPYRQQLADGRPGVIELPVSPSMDDWSLGLTTRMAPRPMFTREHVDVDLARRAGRDEGLGRLLTTVLHRWSGTPQSGCKILREFLSFAREFGDVWIATGERSRGISRVAKRVGRRADASRSCGRPA